MNKHKLAPGFYISIDCNYLPISLIRVSVFMDGQDLPLFEFLAMKTDKSTSIVNIALNRLKMPETWNVNLNNLKP